VVTDLPLLVEDKRFRIRAGAKKVGNRIPVVPEHGKWQAVLLCMFTDSIDAVLPIGIDGQELYPAGSIFLVERRQADHVEIVDRTLGAGKEDDNGFPILEAVQGNALAVDVW